MGEGHREGVEDDQAGNAEQRDPDRTRDVTRRFACLLRRPDTGVEPDEHPSPHRQCGEHAGSDRSARQRLCPERVRREREVLDAEDEQQGESDPERRDDLGADPDLDDEPENRDAERPCDRAEDEEKRTGGHDPARRRLDPREGQCPRGSEIGDRRVRRRVRADRHPPVDPPVGLAHQAPAPLVRAARDGELGGELGVHREQQALACERDRQHPHPGRARHRRADQHHRVEADDR